MAWTFDDFDLSEWKVTLPKVTLPNDADYYAEDEGRDASLGETDSKTNGDTDTDTDTDTDNDGGDASGWDFSVMDLSDWRITLPEDENGGSDGAAAGVVGDDFEGFESEDFFYYDADQGGFVFRTPVEGAKTSAGTTYTRTELREMDGDEDAAWTIEEGGTLSATLKVTEFAQENDGDAARVIVGQIHGEDDELARLYVDSDGELYYANETTGSDGAERFFKFENEDGERPNVALGEEFSYVIDVSDGQLTVQVYVDGEVYTADGTVFVFDDSVIAENGETHDPAEIVDAWYDDTFYFKAGVYQCVNTNDGHFAQGTGTTEAVFTEIDFSHTEGEGLDGWLGGDISDGTVDKGEGLDGDISDGTVDNDGGDDGGETLTTPGSTTSGTSGDDTLIGSSAGETLKGQAGDDVIKGAGGDDVLWGNDGDDVISGGTGADWLKGGNGADTYVLTDTADTDTIADFSIADGDKIDLTGVLEGVDGFVQADAIADGFLVVEQSGDDTNLYVNIDGQPSLVAVLLDEDAAVLDLSDFILPEDTPVDVVDEPVSETFEGTNGADDITGTDGDDFIDGLQGGDTIDGGAGNDTVYGGGGADELRGDAGDDVLQGDDGNDLVKGGDGDDEIHGGTGSDELWGNDGDDTIHAGEGGNWIKGGAGADSFVFTTVDGIDTIADFSQDDGDSIDLSAVLDGATGLTGDVVADGFVQFEQDGDDTLVYIDLDGYDGSGGAETMLTLLNQDASALSSSDLVF